ncbi:hypothetical protein EV652_105115 [Kribbella steppae]|uniref:Uncharacterized protein n=1 Tax=Kribbella steppae TaxID=2512223 RepID=A0A4R2HNE4_9ACTN|nr:hypothetical protein [Kribbella steppae]TCO30121.1 hypothetical protein EV652_105115 [Kribbella steppae]
MFMTPQSIKAETTYRQERQYRAATRRERAERTPRPEPRRTRRALRPTTAA